MTEEVSIKNCPPPPPWSGQKLDTEETSKQKKLHPFLKVLSVAAVNYNSRDHRINKPETFTLWPFREKHANPWL